MIDKIPGGGDISKLIDQIKELLDKLKGGETGAGQETGLEDMSPQELADLFRQIVEALKEQGGHGQTA